jgi:hypothetical protein
VGFTRKPPLFLQPGDKVAIEIEGVGVLENTVVAEGETHDKARTGVWSHALGRMIEP